MSEGLRVNAVEVSTLFPLVKHWPNFGWRLPCQAFTHSTDYIHPIGTWNPPAFKRDAEQEYRDGHISGAVRFDIATVANKEVALMLPPPEQFGKQVGEVRM